MTLKEIYHGVINLAETAHHLAPGLLRYPHRDDVGPLSAPDRAALHRRGVVCRDFALGVEHAIRALSESTLKTIARK
jgi:hypothetical protein